MATKNISNVVPNYWANTAWLDAPVWSSSNVSDLSLEAITGWYAAYKYKFSNVSATVTACSIQISAVKYDTMSGNRTLRCAVFADDYGPGSSTAVASKSLYVSDSGGTWKSLTFSFSNQNFTAKELIFYFYIADDQGEVDISAPKISLSASLADLNIEKIEPNPVTIAGTTGNKCTITFKNRLGADLSVVISNGNTQLYSTTAKKDTLEIDCLPAWFSETGETNTISVQITDSNSGFSRTARSSFTLKMPQFTLTRVSSGEKDVGTNEEFKVTDTLNGSVLRLTVKFGNDTKIDKKLLRNYSIGNNTYSFQPSSDWFYGIASDTMQCTVLISDDTLGRKEKSYTFTLVCRGYEPTVDVELENIPYTNMPEGMGYVSGYSRVKVIAKVKAPFGVDSITASGGGLSGEKMVYDHYDQDIHSDIYICETPKTSYISGQTTFNVTVKDHRTKQATNSTTVSNVTKLPDIVLYRNPSSGNIEAGDSIQITAENYISSYTYKFTARNVTLVDHTDIVLDDTITQDCDADWFLRSSEEGKTLSVTFTLTDVIGRQKQLQFTVQMPDFKLVLDNQHVTLGGDLNIKVIGRTDFYVDYTFSVKKSDGYFEFAESYNNSDEWKTSDENIEFTKALFTEAGVANKATIEGKIDAVCGSIQSYSVPFWIDFPALTLTLSGTETIVGDTLTYSFGNRENEQITLDYYFQNRKLILPDTYQYNVNEVEITTPQLFDSANANTLRRIYVEAVISDQRGRTAKVSNLQINASDSMAPVVSNFTVEPINPDTIDSKFEEDFINNISKIRASATITPTTNAQVKKENVYFVCGNVRYQATSKSGNVFGCDISKIILDSPLVSLEGTDERGLSIPSLSIINTSYDYSIPKATISYHRCMVQDGVVIPNDSGEFCDLTVDYNFAGIWREAFPPYPENRGTITVSTTGYEETQNSWLSGHTEVQNVDLILGYGINNSGEVIANTQRAATINSITLQQGQIYALSFDGEYYADYAIWIDGTFDRMGQANSGYYFHETFGNDIQLYLSLRRKEETSEPVDVAEANMQLSRNVSPTESGVAKFLIPNMDMEHSYTINITLSDLITTVSYQVRLSTAGVIMDFLAGGKGIGLGKVAERRSTPTVEVNPEWTFLSENIQVKVSDKTISSLSNYSGQVLDLGTVLKYILDKL